MDNDSIQLIAHRGGVIESTHPENSPAALDAAVARGYAGVEIDLRETSDQQIVCYHDATVAVGFLRRRRIRDLTLAEVRGYAGSWVLTLEEMLERCSGRVTVMIDVKSETESDWFCERIADSLQSSGLDERCWVIGTSAARRHLRGVARTAVSVGQIRGGNRTLSSLSIDEFVFGHGTELDDQLVQDAVDQGKPVVPSINRFHYLPRLNPLPPAAEDIIRLLALGLTVFQIDSEFDQFFPGFHR